MKSRTLSLSLALAASVLCSLQANAALAHRWSFDNNQDSVGGANLNLVGGASFTGGQLELPGGGARTNYASAPGITGTLASSQSVTIEAWFTLDTLQNWSKVWMFGTAGAQPALSYIDYTPYTGLAGNLPKIDFDSNIGNELNTGGDAAGSLLSANTQYYVAAIYDATNNLMSFYTNGVLTDSASMGGGNITQLGNTAQNFFGAAVNFNDPDMDGRINEVRIWNTALTAGDITSHNALGPNVVPEPGVSLLGLLAAGALLGRRRRA